MSVKRLDSGIDAEVQQLENTIGGGFSGEVLGYSVMYSVGYDFNCIVPRDWLIDQAHDLDLPEWILPNKSTPLYAYKRAMKWMREDWMEPYFVDAPRLDNPSITEDHKVTVDLKEGDGEDIWHVRAEIFFNEEESGQVGGVWNQHDLGYFSYNREMETFNAYIDDGLNDDSPLQDVWQDVSSAGEAIFRKMQHSHIAGDIRRMLNSVIKSEPNVIQLRRAVYLFPAGMIDFIQKMAELYNRINDQHKSMGEPVAIRTIEVLNTDDKRDWIQHKVEETLSDNMDSIISSAFDHFDEGEAAEEIVQKIRTQLDESEETAATYNNLLRAEISVEEVLQKHKSQIENDEKEEIIEGVISQADIQDF